MAERGRKPMSAAEKVAAGNPGHRPIVFPSVLPESDRPTIPRPKFLVDRAAEIWDEYADELIKIGQLTKLRVHQFAMWCTLAAEFEKLAARGETLLGSKITQMNSLAQSFGMNGDPRKIPAANDKPVDPAEKYLD